MSSHTNQITDWILGNDVFFIVEAKTNIPKWIAVGLNNKPQMEGTDVVVGKQYIFKHQSQDLII